MCTAVETDLSGTGQKLWLSPREARGWCSVTDISPNLLSEVWLSLSVRE